MYYVFNYAFNIQLIFNIQRVIQYSTLHSTFMQLFILYSIPIQQFQPFIQHSTLIFKTFNYSFKIQLFILYSIPIQQFQPFIQHSTLIFKTFNYSFNIQL